MYHFFVIIKPKLLDDDKAFLKKYTLLADHIEDASSSECLIQVNSLQEQENSRRLPVNLRHFEPAKQELGNKEEAQIFDEQFKRLEKTNNEKINSVR